MSYLKKNPLFCIFLFFLFILNVLTIASFYVHYDYNYEQFNLASEDKFDSSAKILRKIKVSLEKLEEGNHTVIEPYTKNYVDEEGLRITNNKVIKKCDMLPDPFSSLKLWQDNLEKIPELSSSKDWDGKFDKFLRELLVFMTPEKLLKSISTLPKIEAVEAIYEKAVKRFENQTKYPPIQILVLGGSVTCGALSQNTPVHVNYTHNNYTYLGAEKGEWTERLEDLINGFVGFKLIEIENIAQGGTNSILGTIIVEYDLFPPSMLNPDIIINAYSTNDMQRVSIQRAKEANKTLKEAVFDNLQDFIRGALDKPCRNPPLIIILDDYLGNEQHNIQELMTFNSVMKQLAGYYEIMSVSYADAVRQIVYGDTREEWFSPSWYRPSSFGTRKDFRIHNMSRQVHHSMGGHMGINWVLAFNLLHLADIFCNQGNEYKIDTTESNDELKSTLLSSKKLPPPLLSKASLADYLRRKDTNNNRNKNSMVTQNNIKNCTDYSKECTFKWLQRQMNAHDKKELSETLSGVIDKNNGWGVKGGKKGGEKLGFNAIGGKNSSVLLKFDNLKKPINILTFMIMKSYGEKWENSQVKIIAYKKAGGENNTTTEILSVVLDGFHNSNTSVTYPYAFPLDREVASESDLLLNIQLINGNTFKFTGMAFCHR